MVDKGLATFCPATYRPRTYIVLGQYVARIICRPLARGLYLARHLSTLYNVLSEIEKIKEEQLYGKKSAACSSSQNVLLLDVESEWIGAIKQSLEGSSDHIVRFPNPLATGSGLGLQCP